APGAFFGTGTALPAALHSALFHGDVSSRNSLSDRAAARSYAGRYFVRPDARRGGALGHRLRARGTGDKRQAAAGLGVANCIAVPGNAPAVAYFATTGAMRSVDQLILRRDSNRRRCTRISIRWCRRRRSRCWYHVAGHVEEDRNVGSGI